MTPFSEQRRTPALVAGFFIRRIPLREEQCSSILHLAWATADPPGNCGEDQGDGGSQPDDATIVQTACRIKRTARRDRRKLSQSRDFASRPKGSDSRLEGDGVLQAGNGCLVCDVLVENGRVWRSKV